MVKDTSLLNVVKQNVYLQFFNEITTTYLLQKTILLWEFWYILISYSPNLPLKQSWPSFLFSFLYLQTFYCCFVFKIRDESWDQVLTFFIQTLLYFAAVIRGASVSRWTLCVVLNFNKKIVMLDGLYIWQGSSAPTKRPWLGD